MLSGISRVRKVRVSVPDYLADVVATGARADKTHQEQIDYHAKTDPKVSNTQNNRPTT